MVARGLKGAYLRTDKEEGSGYFFAGLLDGKRGNWSRKDAVTVVCNWDNNADGRSSE